MEEAPPEERVGELLLVVAGDENDGPLLRGYLLLRLVDMKLHAIELQQQIVGKLDVRLVDLVDQQDRLHVALECLPELSRHDVVRDVVHAFFPELGVAQPRHRIVLVEALLGLAGGFDVPGDERAVQGERHFLGETRLAGARFAFDE